MMRLTWIAFAVLILSAARAVAGDGPCDGLGTTVTPVHHPYSRAVAAHWAQLEALPIAADVLVLGDSHAHLWPISAWGPLRTFNAGAPGETTENLLWRLQSPEWRKITPRNVLIMIGSNNLARGDCGFAIVAGDRAVFEKVKELWPEAKALYVGIPPRGPNGSLRQADRQAINLTLRNAAMIYNIGSIDVDAALSECADCFQPGAVHLTEKGYRLLTASTKPRLR